MIYTTGGIKGGCGKTTIAINLAIFLSKTSDVLLVDADEQETSTEFTELREQIKGDEIGYTQVKLTGESVRNQIIKLAPKYDNVIIDTGGRDTTSQRAALSVSDVYLTPFNPRSFDVWTLERVENLVSEIKIVRPNLKAFSFLNRADVKGADNIDAATFLAQSEVIKYLPAPIINRKVFSNAASFGLGVIEFNKPTDEKAILELKTLFEMIFENVLLNKVAQD